jgi:HSP20 family protein
VAFTRWDPLRDLIALQERIERLGEAGGAAWTPAVDLYETTDRYIVSAELPGLTRDHIEIQVHDGHLTIRGQRPSLPIPCEQYHRLERGHGAFLRRFALPAALDVDQISADLKDGVLTITIPKAAGAVLRRIDVS